MIAKEMSALTLTFDESISAAKAEAVRKSVAGDQKVNATASGAPMWCGSKWSSGDANGSWTIGYQCGSTRTLPWEYQLSAAVRAIVVGYVGESGLDRWRNGSFAGHLAPHVEPPDYHFHGTMKPVYVGTTSIIGIFPRIGILSAVEALLSSAWLTLLFCRAE
ncbi:hypothetical protein [Nonomuraea pusilla]|uniref:Uncharacterized protein n=1 Tax=Nonomuraea pusilla TaxID=46177 RepID=A0A1H7X362_9ACTN|nr:hypothetical protein [Nonomuraea pusilla]SEM28034.1 hypothetical protein SAMN05660976_04726 [Nonomuraea pusilla]